MLRRVSLGCVSSILAFSLHAQTLKIRDKAADYPVHADLQHGFSIGADYLVHTVPSATGNSRDGMIANDYLVIEIGVFGPRGSSLDLLSNGVFELSINSDMKDKMTITPEAPGAVASSIKFDDHAQRSRIQMAGSAGPVNVGTAPNRGPRFPGDPTGNHPISTDGPEITAPVEKDAPISVDERINRASLQTRAIDLPACGLIYFPFAGKTKSIKTLELVYEGVEGKVSLKLE